MKTLKEFYFLLSCLILSISFPSCQEDGPDDDIIYDFYPINFHFTLTGENGEDLLNPATPGTYAGLNITATYGQKTYTKDVRVGSRAYFAELYGLRTAQLKNGKYTLLFGELDGARTYKDSTITIDWKDGTKDVLTFSAKIKWKGNKPKAVRTFKLNGETVAENTSDPYFELKKKPLQTNPSSEMEWDIAPLVFNIYLSNKAGNDLLNKSIRGHINLDSIKAIFRGREYYVNDKQYTGNESRAYLPQFTGLTRPWHHPNDTRNYPVLFGELDGTETFENETLIMDWGSLGRDTITFNSRMEWKDNRPFFIRNYQLNGKEVDKDSPCPIIRIKKMTE